MELIFWPNPILKEKSEAIAAEEYGTGPLRELAMFLSATQFQHRGLGISAVQVGIPKRLFVIGGTGTGFEAMTCVNPVIHLIADKQPLSEGCLSVPGFYGTVSRGTRIVASWSDELGKRFEEQALTGVAAHAFQHEYDHMSGKLFVDRLDVGAKDRLRKHMKSRSK